MSRQIEYLKKLYQQSQNMTERNNEACESLRTSSYSILSSLFGEQSIYVRQLGKLMSGYAGAFLTEVRAILRSAITDLENGALSKYEQHLLLGTFEDFLIQAKELNKGGEEGKKPAAVLTVGVFEDFLSRLCTVSGLTPPDSAQAKIDLLRSKGIIDTIQSSRLGTIKQLRNFAFHADWNKFTNADVGRSIKDLEELMSILMAS